MPLIQVAAEKGMLEKPQQDELMARVSNAVLKAERAPIDFAGAQALTWAYYSETAVGSTYIGGANIESPPLRVTVTTPEGALNMDTRAELVSEIGKIVDDIVGVYEGRLNHWALLHEIAEGSWAGGGHVFPLVGIKEAMNIQ